MDKVTEAMGYEVEAQQIENAVHEYQNISTARLKRELKRLETIFEAVGGRGVDLADKIDNIRIAIAARE